MVINSLLYTILYIIIHKFQLGKLARLLQIINSVCSYYVGLQEYNGCFAVTERQTCLTSIKVSVMFMIINYLICTYAVCDTWRDYMEYLSLKYLFNMPQGN